MKKKDQYAKWQFWNTTWRGSGNKPEVYCKTDRALLFHPSYTALSESAKNVYLLLRCSCGGDDNKYFTFPYSEAKRAGYSEKTFRRAINELQEHRFIEQDIEVQNGMPSRYRFRGDWLRQ